MLSTTKELSITSNWLYGDSMTQSRQSFFLHGRRQTSSSSLLSSSLFMLEVVSLHQMIFLGVVTTSKRNHLFLTAAIFSISSKTGFASTNIGTNVVTTAGVGVTNCRRSATFINVWRNTIEAETELVFRFLHNKQRNKLARLLFNYTYRKHHDFGEPFTCVFFSLIVCLKDFVSLSS